MRNVCWSIMICVACILSACGRDSASINTSEPPVVQNLSEMTTEQNTNSVTKSDFVEYGDNEGAEKTEITTIILSDETATVNSDDKLSPNYSVKNLQTEGFWWADLSPDEIYDAIANAFIDKDIAKIKSFFCKKTQMNYQLDIEIANALEMIDGDLIECKSDLPMIWQSGYSYSDGGMMEHHSDVYIEGLRSDTGRVYQIIFNLKDIGEDEEKIGVHAMTLREETGKFKHKTLYCIGDVWD